MIGVGSMGRPMAENLIRAGYEVGVCDLREEALAPFQARDIPTSHHAKEHTGADLVIVMVGNDADVRDVTVGTSGLLDAIDSASPPIVVIMSSVLPKTIFDAGSALRTKNTAVVDAPVSGGPVRAAEATMSIMAAGPDDIFAQLKPVFDVLGHPVFHCGPVGSAAGVKIVNNILGVADMLLMNEAALLASRLGIDLPFLLGVMEVSSGRNAATQSYGGYRDLLGANARDPDVTRRLLMILRKDLKLASTLAAATGLATPVLDAVSRATDSLEEGNLHARWRALVEAMPESPA
jgi:3-hydroxyisobutyrate dehydrogenase-like beta-hydroxyacid dehydrogenase